MRRHLSVVRRSTRVVFLFRDRPLQPLHWMPVRRFRSQICMDISVTPPTATNEIRCRNCRYILDRLPVPQTLPEPRCPECGRAFDPNDPVTYWSPVDAERRSGFMILATACAGLVIAVTVWFIIVLGWFPRWLYAHNNAILASTAISSLLVEIGVSIVALRRLLDVDREPAKVLHYSALGIATVYFAFFGMLLL